ncbi:MAG: capsular polysaccharide synthesis protein [Candidatus Coprovivens sp.]
MENSILNRIKRALNKGDLFYKLLCLIYIKLGFSNIKLQALEIRNKKYGKINKKYKRYIKNYNNQSEKNDKDIWVCWFQGIENAPLIVKKCFESLKKHNSDKIIHVITEDNVLDYVSLPDYIVLKWKNGVISNTHFSDIIRTELLLKYGGVWIDATTYFTDRIPDYVYDKEVFLYKYYDSSDETIEFNSWFIYSNKNSNLLMTVRDLIYAYWKNEKKLKEYFLWHFFLTMSYKFYFDRYSKIYKITDENCHTLQNELSNEYDEEYFEIIKLYSPIHKLTYKINLNNLKSNSFYDFIINH